MTPFDWPDARLRALDGAVGDYIAECRSCAERGESSAHADIDGLWVLARSLRRSARAWRAHVDRLDLARLARLDGDRAARLTAESVFDEVLTPAASAVFTAALALANPGR